MRAALAIINARATISTTEGDKSTGELADFIERETQIVELIDAAQRLLRAYDESASGALAGDHNPPQLAREVEDLRAALQSVTDRPETVSSPTQRNH
jgi:hypothetical protein